MQAKPVALRRLGLGVVITATFLTSACAAGQRAQTADQKPTLDGTETNVGDLKLRGLVIDAPTAAPSFASGGDVAVKLVVVNSGQRADTLTSVTSSAITGWGSYPSADATAVLQAAQSSSAVAPAVSSTAPGTGSSTATATPVAVPPVPVSVPAPKRIVPIPGDSRVSWGVPDSTTSLLLLGLRKTVYPGTEVSLKFTFARAGSVTVLVPVAITDGKTFSFVPAPSVVSGD